MTQFSSTLPSRFLPSVRRQQPRPAPVSESGEGREEAQKKAAAGQRRANQEEPPQEFSVSRFAFHA